jgi:hypothetical protein
MFDGSRFFDVSPMHVGSEIVVHNGRSGSRLISPERLNFRRAAIAFRNAVLRYEGSIRPTGPRPVWQDFRPSRLGLGAE